MSIPTLNDLLADDPLWLDVAVPPSEAAKIAGRSEGALAVLRCRGNGPSYIKHGQSVRYTRRDLLTWLQANRRETKTSEVAGRGRPRMLAAGAL